MHVVTTPQLPWSALSCAAGHIPWSTLERFAEALSADATLWVPLKDLFCNCVQDSYTRPNCECLYVPGIVTLAARTLDDSLRPPIAQLFINELVGACEADMDELADALTAAVGALGPQVLPSVVEAIRIYDGQAYSWYHLWNLTGLAAETDDAELRGEVVSLCYDTLDRGDAGELDTDDIWPAVWTLGLMRHEPARPRLEKLYRDTPHDEVAKALQYLDGTAPNPWDGPYWLTPVRQWLQNSWEQFRIVQNRDRLRREEDERDPGEVATNMRGFTLREDATFYPAHV